MEKNMGSNFRELAVWQKAHQLVLDIYKISAQFPITEQFCMTQQLRRAAYSIPANIAEGCSRGYAAELKRFTGIVRGSLGEVEYFLLLGKDLGYLSEEEYLALELNVTRLAGC
ncbi:MAG: hypothetical protein Kow00111_25850 [Thermincola ferriacetica]